MYIPAAFSQPDKHALFDLVERHAFGLLLSSAGGMTGSHVPFLLDRARGDSGSLLCHLAAANPQATLVEGQEVLCIFQGAHGYISPTWYAKKPAVPTWNYQAVHAYGTARTTREPAVLRALVERLTAGYEGPAGWKLADEPESFAAGLLRGIVGIEIAVTRLEGKFKLSQNRPSADVDGAIAHLRNLGDEGNLALADAMVAATSPAPSRHA